MTRAPADIWDGYANWTEAAANDPDDALKRKITGAADWVPNHLPPGLEACLRTLAADRRHAGAEAVALDFGCGLGRNAPILRPLFPRLIGFDLPGMVARLKAPEFAPAARLYDALYDDLGILARSEPVHVVYDSVVFQHILHEPTVAAIMAELLRMPGLTAFVTLKNQKVAETLAQRILREQGWTAAFSETDETSFQGAHYGIRHDLVVARRPA